MTFSTSHLLRKKRDLNNNGNEPDVIAFGLDFHDEKDIKGDTELINACREHKNVCISSTVETKTKKTAMAKKVRLVSMTSGTDNPDGEIYAGTAAYNPPQGTMGGEKITGVSTPFKALLPHIATGVINTARSDEDGYVRNLIASVNYNDTHYESFPIIIFRMYLYQNGKDYDIPEANYENELGINYSKNGGNFKTYSYYDVITGKVDKKRFKNSVVLVGDYTSHSSGPSMIFISAVLIAGQVASSCVLNVWGYYIPLLRIIMLIITIAVVNLIAGYIIIKRQRYSLEKVFKKYVDEQVVNEIKDGGIDVAIGGKRKNIAVLFVDIRGFTPLSENLLPEQVVDILNSYLTIIADAVANNGGTLDKFIGDAAMAVFNSPSDLDDYVFRAMCTAWDIVSNGAALRRECLDKYGVEVEFGIGIHCGDAVIGNIGSQSRMEYTAIGDTVNTASRLEGVAEPGQILITRAVARGAGNRAEISFAGEYSLKGKKKKIVAYEINNIKERPAPLKREKSIEEKYADGIKEIKKVQERYLTNVQGIKEEIKEGIKEGIKEAGSSGNGIAGIIAGKSQNTTEALKGGK